MKTRTKSSAAIAIFFGSALVATACGPMDNSTSEATDGAPTAAAAPAPAKPPERPLDKAGLATLNQNLAIANANWYMVDGVSVGASPDPGPVAGQQPVQLPALASAGLHRVGFNYATPNPASVLVTVWLKGTDGVHAMLEIDATVQGQPEGKGEYGVGIFDLAAATAIETELVTDRSRIAGTAIAADGDWRRITVPFETRDGQIYVNIGLVVGGKHVFDGDPAQQLTIGGVEVAPR